MNFPENLQILLIKKKMKKVDLAKMLNVSGPTITYYCNGKREPNLTNLEEIAKILDVSIDELVK